MIVKPKETDFAEDRECF